MILPKYAGRLYEGEYVRLDEQMSACYDHSLGPGDLPLRRKEARMYGLVVPCSPYSLSGPCAAWAYKLLAESYFPETYVLLLPDTKGVFVNYVTCLEDFQTVFGSCSVDKPFAQALLQTGIVSRAETIDEVALELQLPFLLHACRDRIQDIRILPIVVPHSHNIEKLAEEIVRIKKDIVILIVSDFTPYGPQYLYTPYKYSVDDEIQNVDLSLVKFLLNFDSEALLKFVKRYTIPLPGKDALVLGIEILKQLGVREGELLSYYRSSDISSEKENSVGFASLVF